MNRRTEVGTTSDEVYECPVVGFRGEKPFALRLAIFHKYSSLGSLFENDGGGQ